MTDYQEGRKALSEFTAAEAAKPFLLLTPLARQHEEAIVLAGLKRLGFGNVTAADFHRLQPKDEYEKEIVVMAEVRAYFKVAYKVRSITAQYYTLC